MIKQIKSSELKNYLKNNPNSVLLDVRTKAEWKDGEKPNGEALNSKTYFITVSPDLTKWQEPDPNFVENVKKEISTDKEFFNINFTDVKGADFDSQEIAGVRAYDEMVQQLNAELDKAFKVN